MNQYQQHEHYIYTLYDFPDIEKDNNTTVIKNLRMELGKRTAGIINDNYVKEIKDKGLEVANAMIEYQIKRENRVYSALGIKGLSKDSTEEDKNRLIVEMREKIYGINNKEKSTGIKNAEECINLIADFLDEFLNEKNELADSNKSSEQDLKEAVYQLVNLKNSFIDKYKGRQTLIEKIGEKNLISAENILDVMSSWNDEISESLKKNKIILYEDKENNKINGSLNIEELKKVIKAYKNKRNDIFGSIGEAGSIYLIKSGEEEIIKQIVNGEEKEIGKRTLKAETTSRWDLTAYKKYHDEYEATVEKVLNKLKESEVVDKLFTIDTTKNLKADEVYTITLKFDNEKIKEEIVQFGISNKMSSSGEYSLPIQKTSLIAILDNLPKVESTAYSATKIVRSKLINLLLNAAAEIQWLHSPIVIGKVEDLVKQIVNDYGYIWLTGGLSNDENYSTSHADFFSLYKKGKLYFVPMSIILMDAVNRTGTKQSPFIFKGSFLKKDSIPDEDLVKLDIQKRNGNFNFEPLVKKILGISGKSTGIITKSNTIEISSYKRLNLGEI